jgi:hypothetical protein
MTEMIRALGPAPTAATLAAYTHHVKWCLDKLRVIPMSRFVFTSLRQAADADTVRYARPMTEDSRGQCVRIEVHLETGATHITATDVRYC